MNESHQISRRHLLGGAAVVAGSLALGGKHSVLAQSISAQSIPATPQPGGSLSVAGSIDITDPDPQISNLLNHHYLAWEGLTGVTASGELKPMLAETYEASDDATTYTFTLRQGVKFQNGRDLTADDVKWSLDRIKDPGTRAFRGNDLKDVTIEVVDSQTVRLTSSTPNAALPAALASCFILAPESVDDDGKINGGIGTGPFVFQSWTPETETRFTRNPNYWMPGLPYLDEVVYQVIADSDARLTALRSQTIDIGSALPTLQLPLIAGDSSIVTQQTTANISAHLTFNWSNLQAPLDDIRVRQAIAYALNKQDLLTATVGTDGPGIVNNQLASPDDFWRLAVDDPFATPDLDQAKALLAEAGQDGGFSVSLVAWDVRRAPAEVIKEQLGEIGIDVELIFPPDFTSYLTELQANKYHLLYDESYPRDDPAYLFTFFDSANEQNIYYGTYGNPDVDAKLSEAIATADPDQRRAAYAAALQTLENEDISSLFTTSRRDVWGNLARVQNFVLGAGQLHRIDGGLAVTWLAS